MQNSPDLSIRPSISTPRKQKNQRIYRAEAGRVIDSSKFSRVQVYLFTLPRQAVQTRTPVAQHYSNALYSLILLRPRRRNWRSVLESFQKESYNFGWKNMNCSYRIKSEYIENLLSWTDHIKSRLEEQRRQSLKLSVFSRASLPLHSLRSRFFPSNPLPGITTTAAHSDGQLAEGLRAILLGSYEKYSEIAKVCWSIPMTPCHFGRFQGRVDRNTLEIA